MIHRPTYCVDFTALLLVASFRANLDVPRKTWRGPAHVDGIMPTTWPTRHFPSVDWYP